MPDEEDYIILRVRISRNVADRLDKFIGLKGKTREEVASHYISVSNGENGIPKAKGK